MNYFLTWLAVISALWSNLWTENCSDVVPSGKNRVRYCENAKFESKIDNVSIRQIRFKALSNLRYVVLQNEKDCPHIDTVTLKRNIFNKYKIEINCEGKKRKLELQNDYLTVKFDESYNDNSFLWDDSFISWWMMKYDPEISISTIDYWWSRQVESGDDSGFIPREVDQKSKSVWEASDPSSSAPMILGRIELEYYKLFKRKKRLGTILPKLVNYFEWIEKHRKTTKQGIDYYFWNTIGSGMDNLPRCEDIIDCGYSDLISQQAALAKEISEMAFLLGINETSTKYSREYSRLSQQIRKNYWDETDSFVYNIDGGGKKIKSLQSVAFVWVIYAHALEPDKEKIMINKYMLPINKFGGIPWLPSVSRDSDYYHKDGAYWRGGVWPPLVWIGYWGLKESGYNDEAKAISEEYLHYFDKLWVDEGTLYEYYKPILINDGLVGGEFPDAKKDFWGWGILPIGLYNSKE